MNEITRMGARLKARRVDLGWSQIQLSSESGVSERTIGSIERGQSFRWSTVAKLAVALDMDPTEVNDKRSRIAPVGPGVLAVRNAVYDPSHLPGLTSEQTGEPATVEELKDDLERAYGAYFAGEFGALAAELPALLARCRATQTHLGRTETAGVYAHVWQLAACLLTQTGKTDAALAATERAISTAQDDTDEWRQATMYGTYSWVLLHAGRYREGEQLATRIADTIKPDLNPAVDRRQMVAWGGLMLHAAVLAGGGERVEEADEYLTWARAGAGLLGEDRHDYWVSFGPSHVGVQTAHINTGFRRPDRVLKAHKQVHAGDLFAVQRARHMLNISESLRLRKRPEQAEAAARQAFTIGGDQWARQQRFGVTLVSNLEADASRPSDALRELRGVLGRSEGSAV